MKNLAIIPARGGSKRIPRKNIKDFLGKPIIAYSIEVALKSGLFDEVMVSTDDKEIAEIAIQYGAKVPFMRSVEKSNDYATLSDVIKEVINQYEMHKVYFKHICCILPTAALITDNLLKNSYKLLLEKNADAIYSVVKFSYPIQRGLKFSKNGVIEYIYPEYRYSRSQDLDQAYHDSGMFYWIKPDTVFQTQNKYGFELSELQCQDIDSETDWSMAELKYLYLEKCSQ